MSGDGPIVVLYRWRLHPGAESAFVEAWTAATRALEQRGSLGSRLHRGSDGAWYGYAQWPDAATREAARGAVPAEVSVAMGAAVESSLSEVVLAPVADLLHAVRLATDRRPG